MKQNFFIITGTSRGIGESLARKLIHEENSIICISRTQNPRLEVEAKYKKGNLVDLALDLNETGKIRDLVRSIFREIQESEVARITLVNNAGIIHPIRNIGGPESTDKIIRNMNVNLVAAMLVTEAFIFETRNWKVDKRIVNMLTGAGRRPVDGWSAYCTAKAGLEMFTRCIARDAEREPFPVKVVGFTPGVVDTEMQTEIRATDPEVFAEHSKFVGFKEKGELLDPGIVAEKLIHLMGMADFGKELMVDVHEIG